PPCPYVTCVTHVPGLICYLCCRFAQVTPLSPRGRGAGGEGDGHAHMPNAMFFPVQTPRSLPETTKAGTAIHGAGPCDYLRGSAGPGQWLVWSGGRLLHLRLRRRSCFHRLAIRHEEGH